MYVLIIAKYGKIMFQMLAENLLTFKPYTGRDWPELPELPELTVLDWPIPESRLGAGPTNDSALAA